MWSSCVHWEKLNTRLIHTWPLPCTVDNNSRLPADVETHSKKRKSLHMWCSFVDWALYYTMLIHRWTSSVQWIMTARNENLWIFGSKKWKSLDIWKIKTDYAWLIAKSAFFFTCTVWYKQPTRSDDTRRNHNHWTCEEQHWFYAWLITRIIRAVLDLYSW
jgi:hypothetical protein